MVLGMALRHQTLKRVVVRRLTKSGAPSKAPLTNAEWQLNAFTGIDAALVRVDALKKLNPGADFVVCDIASNVVVAR